MSFAIKWLEEKMIERIHAIKETIYAKTAAVVGVAAVFGLALIIGIQQPSEDISPRRTCPPGTGPAWPSTIWLASGSAGTARR